MIVLFPNPESGVSFSGVLVAKKHSRKHVLLVVDVFAFEHQPS